MTHLINADDGKILAGSEFVKNAVFYKDMLAFYDAYEKIMSYDKELLPNYCFNQNKNYLIDGICLLIKNYASEFKFETIKLSLEYLKVLYYTIAAYSTDENLPDKSLILTEIESYKQASVSMAETEKKNYDKKYNDFVKAQQDYDKFAAKYAKELVFSKVSSLVSIIVLVVGLFASAVTVAMFYMEYLTKLVAMIISISSAVIAIGVFSGLKIATKRITRKAGDVAYILQNKKKSKDALWEEAQQIKAKYNRILIEKYEYKSNFAEEVDKHTKHISFDTLIKKAAEYKLLSYNIKLDIANLFESHNNETQEVLGIIDIINPKNDGQKALQNCYKLIKEKDWLFYNNEIRYSYLRKFVEVADNTYEWKIEDDGKKVNPFGINIKAIAKEKITYLKSKQHLFVAATLDKFLNTNYIKNTKVLALKGLNDSDSIKNMKVEYLTKFLDYEGTKTYNNLFYDKKIIDGVTVSDDIIENNEKIPTFINLKLKMVEAKQNITNGDSLVIKQIASDIAKIEAKSEAVSIIEPILDQDIDTYTTEDLAEDFGDYIRYNVGGDTFIGYKI